MKKTNGGLISGAFTLSVGVIIAKLIGAFYRIPLTRLIGTEGIGIYQLVFPFYCTLLTISSSGIPSAVSKLVAEGRNAKKVLYKSIIVFGLLGLVGSFAMFFLAENIARLQGNVSSALSYKTLSPSVFFVSIISAIRGYFQGKSRMKPTAISQIIEQAVKLSVGLTLIYFIPLSTPQQSGVACLAVSASEFFALVYVLVAYRLEIKTVSEVSISEISTFKIVKTVLPVAISSALIPLARVVDSFLILHLLKLESVVATSEFGIYSGIVESLIGLPVAVCYGLAVSGLPILAKDKTNKKFTKKMILSTFVLGLAFSTLTVFFGGFGVKILYPKLKSETLELTVKLLQVSSVQIVLLSLLQTVTSVLIAKDKLIIPPINLAVGVMVKIFLTVVLASNSRVGIYGLAISDISCYFVAVSLDLLYIISNNNSKNKLEKKASFQNLTS